MKLVRFYPVNSKSTAASDTFLVTTVNSFFSVTRFGVAPLAKSPYWLETAKSSV